MMRRLLISTRYRISTLLQTGTLLIGVLLLAQNGFALTSGDFFAVPPTLRAATQPLVMLTMSRDHQLFFKAYTDFDDLDGGGIDSTYKNSFEYYGYFDSRKCYTYSSGNGRFEPASVTANHYCNQGSVTGQWSGNFLNWASMTRIDVLRKVLYGGYRRIDTATSTVLERSYLPYDAHSFAKYYNGSDANYLMPYTFTSAQIGQNAKTSGITICNTTDASGASGTSTALNINTYPPVMRVVRGNYSLWAAGERYQCRYSGDIGSGQGANGNDPDVAANPLKAYGVSPASSEQLAQLRVRVEVCNAALIGSEDCKRYPSGNYKPIGLLQDYGDNDQIHFGLVTGSYLKSKSGGVLRKNIRSMVDEINVATNGTFKAAPATGGIINTLNTLRIVGYDYGDGTYNAAGADNCSWGSNTFNNGSCTNWGNPFSETLLESYRYFAGKTATAAFAQGSTNDKLAGLIQVSWTNPLTVANSCAKLSNIAISTASISFDIDELSGVSDLGTASTAAQLTNNVGSLEGINGTSRFVGRLTTGVTTTDGLCTSKMVSGLGNVAGICPETPRLDGSYEMAGIAYQAQAADIRADLNGSQKVETFGVSLAAAIPQVTVTSPNGLKTVTILPACRNSSISGNCGLVDFKQIVPPTTTIISGTTTVTGTFYVNWEDSEWGGDFDQDMNGILTYQLTNTGLKIITDVVGQSTPDAMGFGYSLSGTTADGFHAQSGVNNFSFTNASGVVECNNCTTANAAVTKSYTLSAASGAALLQTPLWYAAKYGKFNDINQNGRPDTGEWDVRDVFGRTTTEGGTGADGNPDNYFPVRNPATLATSLKQVLQSISSSVASSTAAAVVANSSRGAGAIYQAIYYPQFQHKNAQGEVDDTVNWVGELHALFIDDDGNIREDNGVKGKLEATNIDYVVRIYYDEGQNLTLFQRYSSLSPLTLAGGPQLFERIHSIWSARDNLAALTDSSLLTQRAYDKDTSTATGRYIFTWIDRNRDGIINDNSSTPATARELMDFVDTQFPIATSTPAPTADNQNNYRYLGLADPTQAASVVNYIRGVDGTGRSRLIDFDGSGTQKPWRLGDIIDSSPVIVGAPDANYDRQYGDNTYLAFKQKYENRRQVAYVGGNDGMLHAFNAGKWIGSTKTFDGAGQPLGGELWAYVPSNLLPHLQWLKETNYPHVFYVDGALKSFDVNIFTPDAVHPGGWGTILVAGMRLGGGQFPLDTDGDATNDTTMRSAYIVMDVTDPEAPPTLLAEISSPQLGFTVGAPTIIKRRTPALGSFLSTTANEWLLVFGSGPTNMQTGTSAQSSQVFAWSFAQKQLLTLDSAVVTGMAEANSFVGNFAAVDWDNDFADDAIYAGTVGGTNAAPTGKLKRIKLNPTGLNLGLSTAGGGASAGNLYDPARPVFATPSPYTDTTSGDNWVFFGTGRYLVPQDSQSAAQQAYYGIKEPKTSGVLNYGQVTTGIINATDIHVSTSGSVLGAGGSPLSIDGDPITTFDQLRRKIGESNGWVRYFSVPSGEGATRNFTDTTFYYSSLLFTTYQPDADICSATGDGFEYAISLFTGTAAPFQPIGVDSSSTLFASVTQVEAAVSVSLGKTLPSQPVVSGDKSFIEGGHAEFIQKDLNPESSPFGRQSWREIEINFGL